jgi:hypothetical protein
VVLSLPSPRSSLFASSSSRFSPAAITKPPPPYLPVPMTLVGMALHSCGSARYPIHPRFVSKLVVPAFD